MPFCDDVRDRERLTPDTTAQLVQLTTVAEGLGPDELAVLLLVAGRLRRGRGQYGNLDVSQAPRCFRIEVLEEAADGLVYAVAALMRGGETTARARRDVPEGGSR